MRVNARFDGVAEKQVEYLSTTTGLPLSDVLRDSVDFYYRHMRAQGGALRHLSRLVGQGDSGRSDIAGNVKKYLADGMGDKYGLPPPGGRPVAKPKRKRAP